MIGLPKRLLESCFRISTQLYLGIGSGVVFTIVASLVGWISFDRVGEVQRRVNEGSVPEMAAAFAVAQQSGALVAAAPRLTTAATQGELARIASKIAEDRMAFETQLGALARLGGEAPRSRSLRERGDALIGNIEAIEDSMAERFALSGLRLTRRGELSALRGELNRLLIPLIDDQLFYAMTGYRTLGAPPDPPRRHFSQIEFSRYRHLAELRAGATLAAQLLATAFNVSDAALLEPLRERFEAAARGIERRLSQPGTESLRRRLAPPFARLAELGAGPDGGFGLRAREIALERRQRDLLTRNRTLAIELVAEAEGLVNVARARAGEATRASTEAILAGRNLLLLISAASIIGAALVAWLFVGRVLSRRLGRLSDRMRGMAEGDLEGKVEIGGRDEVADMAAALEVFRRHALEVQRLNLVEKLAEELRGKNDQLEHALAELQRAQDQIVMREKLAALGELTAGVAHEIKNPLNFVKNFSEVSEELLQELLEEISRGADDAEPGDAEPGDAEPDEDSRGLIAEIGNDLTGNLKRIREHGERANRIVQSMLMMGGGSGERQPTDINALLSAHARLAYHSARVSDPDFRIDVEEELDPALGESEVVPQDLGRVFLNMVTNACYATDERRRAATTDAAGGAAASYEPRLLLATRRLADRIEIRIRDNGGGIPPDVADKIFNPFFTTKPTDQGTGLGLSLSNDIVRQHGGSIRVDSEPGAFTEMIIELPADAALPLSGPA